MTISTTDIQALYIAYFNRPADKVGLKFWTDAATNAGSVASVADAFAASDEFAETYSGTEPTARIIAIYNNLFGRDPEPEGLLFWSDALASGKVNFGNVAYQIFKGAQNADKIAVDSKAAAAAAFTESLDTTAEIGGYVGKAANAVVSTWLKGITNPTNLATAITPAALNAVAASAVAAHNGSTNIGQNFNLTIGADNFPGTAGDDTFNALPINTTTGADATTLGNFDVIDGGAGNDTLNIYAAKVGAGFNLVQQGTTTNIETINIFNDGNTAATQFGSTAGVVASKFVGATAIWQAGFANKVTGLAATTTAGFKQITEANLNVGAAAAATSLTVALDQVAGTTAGNASTLTVAGKALKDIVVSGALVKNAAYAGTSAAKLNLDATIGKDVQAITVNSSVKTTVVLHEDADTSATKHLTSVDASASTGGITYSAADTVTSIKTGTGVDNVIIASALTATTKTAAVSTGDGNDIVEVNVVGTAAAGNTVTVDTGAGKDKITLNIDINTGYTVIAGAGDDTVILNGVVKTTDSIDGGEGVDTVAIEGKAGYISGDYLTFTKVLKNFEAIHFTDVSATGFDASQVAAYKSFTFDLDGSITKVAADQALFAGANLEATAAGYVGGAAPVAPAAGSATTYGTTALNVTATNDGTAPTTVVAKGASIALTINALDDAAAGAGDVAVELTGDVKTATVNLVHGVNDDDSFSVASFGLLTADTGVGGDGTGAYTALGGLTSLTLTGNGHAQVQNAAGTKLTTIDASALNSVDADGKASVGLEYVSFNTSVETIKLGGGLDHVGLAASTYGGVGAASKIDTVTGLKLVVDSAGALDLAASDVLSVMGVTTAVKTFTTTQTDIDLALVDAAAYSAQHTNANLVFQVGGNTYVFSDAGSTAGSIDAGDIVVKLTGAVNLDSLILSLAYVAPI